MKGLEAVTLSPHLHPSSRYFTLVVYVRTAQYIAELTCMDYQLDASIYQKDDWRGSRN